MPDIPGWARPLVFMDFRRKARRHSSVVRIRMQLGWAGSSIAAELHYARPPESVKVKGVSALYPARCAFWRGQKAIQGRNKWSK